MNASLKEITQRGQDPFVASLNYRYVGLTRVVPNGPDLHAYAKEHKVGVVWTRAPFVE